MTTLKVQVDEEKDLPLLQKILTDLGFKFSLEDIEHESLPAHVLSGIEEGLKDIGDGRIYGHEQAMSRIKSKVSQLRLNNAGH